MASNNPADSWEDLAVMAGRIQAGERRAGNKDFWGYVWQCLVGEGGTCNALEWQASSGRGNFIEAPGTVHVRSASPFSPKLCKGRRLDRCHITSGEYVYGEHDSVTLWNAGNVVFMRNCGSGYGYFAPQPGNDRHHFKSRPCPPDRVGIAEHWAARGWVFPNMPPIPH
jgi:trehalose/maltose transport system substrate-binding protein